MPDTRTPRRWPGLWVAMAVWTSQREVSRAGSSSTWGQAMRKRLHPPFPTSQASSPSMACWGLVRMPIQPTKQVLRGAILRDSQEQNTP